MRVVRRAGLALGIALCLVSFVDARVLSPATMTLALPAATPGPVAEAVPDAPVSVAVPLDPTGEASLSAGETAAATPSSVAPSTPAAARSRERVVADIATMSAEQGDVDEAHDATRPRPGAHATRGAGVPSVAPLAAALDAATHQDYSPVLRTFVLLSLLSIIPVLLIGLTSFTRIIIVLSLLRHALGLPQTPPNSVLMTLAIFLTLFSMGPVIGRVGADAVQPYLKEQITATQAIEAASGPMKDFMVRQTRETDLAAVLEMARAPRPKTIADIKFGQLAPAFLLSELKTAFQIGFIIFLPFLLVDLVVAAILMALGMIMVPPSTISLPIKLLLFILVDGWVLISRALVGGYWT